MCESNLAREAGEVEIAKRFRVRVNAVQFLHRNAGEGDRRRRWRGRQRMVAPGFLPKRVSA